MFRMPLNSLCLGSTAQVNIPARTQPMAASIRIPVVVPVRSTPGLKKFRRNQSALDLSRGKYPMSDDVPARASITGGRRVRVQASTIIFSSFAVS